MVPDYKPLKLVKRLIYLFDTAQSSQIDFSPSVFLRQEKSARLNRTVGLFCSVLLFYSNVLSTLIKLDW